MSGFGKPTQFILYRADLKMRISEDEEEDIGKIFFKVPDNSKNPKAFNPKNPTHEIAIAWIGNWMINNLEAKEKGINQVFVYQQLSDERDRYVEQVELQNFAHENPNCAKVNVEKTLAKKKVANALLFSEKVELAWF